MSTTNFDVIIISEQVATVQLIRKGDIMNNIEIRQAIREKRLHNYEVAAALGVSEFTFSRKLREELSPEQREHVMRAIERAAAMNSEKEADVDV